MKVIIDSIIDRTAQVIAFVLVWGFVAYCYFVIFSNLQV